MASENIERLRTLSQDPSSCIVASESRLTLLIHPIHAQSINAGILEELDTLTKGYCKQLSGIVMGYEKIKVDKNSSFLRHTNPYTHIDVQAIFYVFAPAVGSILQGVVSKKSESHVSCLVYEKFNVTCLKPRRTEGQEEEELWCGHTAQEGDTVSVRLAFLVLKDHMPYIRADLIPESIPDHSLDESTVCVSQPEPPSCTKRVRFESDDVNCSDTPSTRKTIDGNGKSGKKRKRSMDFDLPNIKSELVSSSDSKKSKKTSFDVNIDIKREPISPNKVTSPNLGESPLLRKKGKRKKDVDHDTSSSGVGLNNTLKKSKKRKFNEEPELYAEVIEPVQKSKRCKIEGSSELDVSSYNSLSESKNDKRYEQKKKKNK